MCTTLYVGLGNLYLQRGNLPAAKRFLLRAQRTAQKRWLREIQEMAAHDLFVIADERNQPREAEAFAAQALRAYGVGHPRLPNLAHDVAVFWMNQGDFFRALPVIRATLPRIHGSRDRLLALGSLARAAGGAGESAEFQNACVGIWNAVESETSAEGAAQALLAAAQGAANLGDWERAERAAARAIEVAAERNEAQVGILAESLLESVRNERHARGSFVQPQERLSETTDLLVSEFIASLEAVGAAT